VAVNGVLVAVELILISEGLQSGVPVPLVVKASASMV
jgi:hypothetical protein